MTQDESRAWDLYAAAALSSNFEHWQDPAEAATRAATAADALLAERAKRTLGIEQKCPASTMSPQGPLPCILVRGHGASHVFPVPSQSPETP